MPNDIGEWSRDQQREEQPVYIAVVPEPDPARYRVGWGGWLRLRWAVWRASKHLTRGAIPQPHLTGPTWRSPS